MHFNTEDEMCKLCFDEYMKSEDVTKGCRDIRLSNDEGRENPLTGNSKTDALMTIQDSIGGGVKVNQTMILEYAVGSLLRSPKGRIRGPILTFCTWKTRQKNVGS